MTLYKLEISREHDACRQLVGGGASVIVIGVVISWLDRPSLGDGGILAGRSVHIVDSVGVGLFPHHLRFRNLIIQLRLLFGLLYLFFSHSMAVPISLCQDFCLQQGELVAFPDVASDGAEVGGPVLAERADEGLLAGVGCQMAGVLPLLVSLVFTMGAAELEYASVGILTILHVPRLHEAIATFIAPVRVIPRVYFPVIFKRVLRFKIFPTLITWKLNNFTVLTVHKFYVRFETILGFETFATYFTRNTGFISQMIII